jgi:hypothetical protein
MAGCAHNDCCAPSARELDSPAWRRAHWIALAVNATLFAAEIGAGVGHHG